MNIQTTNTYRHLLASALKEQPDSYTMEALYQSFPNPAALADATEQELMSIKGIGLSRARLIMATIQLVFEFSKPSPEPTIIRSPTDVQKLLIAELCYVTKEYFICLFLNTKNHLIAKEITSIGTINSSLVHSREVFRVALKRNSVSIICVQS